MRVAWGVTPDLKQALFIAVKDIPELPTGANNVYPCGAQANRHKRLGAVPPPPPPPLFRAYTHGAAHKEADGLWITHTLFPHINQMLMYAIPTERPTKKPTDRSHVAPTHCSQKRTIVKTLYG